MVASVDDALTHAGGLGKYQRNTLMHTGAGFFVCSGSLLLPTFLYRRLEEEWDGFDKNTRVMIDSLFFLGNTLGLLFFGPIGDHFGRRPAINASLALLIVAGALGFASTGVASLAMARFFVGFFVGGLLNACFVLQVELASPAKRMPTKVLLSLSWVGGSLYLTVVAYLVRNSPWQLIIWYLLPAPALLMANLLFMVESPRFLLAQGRQDDACAQLKQLAEVNGRPLPPHLSTLQAPPRDGTRGVREKMMELFHPNLRRRTLLVGLAWFGSTCCYYGVALGAPLPLGGDYFMQNALGNLLEAPAYALMLCADRFGRRRTWATFLIGTAVSLVLLAIINPPQPEPPDGAVDGNETSGDGDDGEPNEDPPAVTSAPGWLLLVLALAARFGATGASALVYVAAAEQWPTTCRNLGVNYGASCGRIGSMLSPFMRLLPSPSAVLGGIGAAAALAVLALPETSGAAMPESVKGVGTSRAGVEPTCASTTSSSASAARSAGGGPYFVSEAIEGGTASGATSVSAIEFDARPMEKADGSEDTLLGESHEPSHVRAE